MCSETVQRSQQVKVTLHGHAVKRGPGLDDARNPRQPPRDRGAVHTVFHHPTRFRYAAGLHVCHDSRRMNGPAELELPVVLADGAVAPAYATAGAAGMDIRSVEDVELAPLERKLVRTGLKLALPHGYEGQIRPRSGLALKFGVSMVNTPGTIDEDFRGEIGVILINLSQNVVKLARGERIAQLVVCPVAKARVTVVDQLDETSRGEGGFGSTGTH